MEKNQGFLANFNFPIKKTARRGKFFIFAFLPNLIQLMTFRSTKCTRIEEKNQYRE
jgi:hypothetical protein